MNRHYSKRPIVNKQWQRSFRFTRMSNGDILIHQSSAVSKLPLLFMFIFFYFWYKALLFSTNNSSKHILDALVQRITQEPFIIIFLVMPLLMFVLSAKQLFRFGRISYRFDAVRQTLYLNNKILCNFNDIEGITIKYTNSSTFGALLLAVNGSSLRTIYNARDYADLSLRANELAALVRAPVKTEAG